MSAKCAYASKTLAIYIRGEELDKLLQVGVGSVPLTIPDTGETAGMLMYTLTWDGVLYLRQQVNLERAAWASAKERAELAAHPAVTVKTKQVRHAKT